MPHHTRLLATCTVLVLAASSFADDAAVIAALTPKGAKFKKERDGTVSELSIGSDATLALDDYKLLGELKSLRRASISPKNPPLNDEVLAAIGPLPTVERFFSNESKFTDDGLKGFAGWTGLKHFGFDHWFGPEGSKGYVGAGLAHFAAMPSLVHVRLGGCRVDNKACEALAKIKTLESVDLFHTFAVTDDGVAALTVLPKLRVIKLGPQYAPRITDATLQHLGKIPTLEEISIVETWLTYERGFAHLKKLPALKTLHFATVLATEEDIAKLKTDHPNAAVTWTLPSKEDPEKLKARFIKHFEKQPK